VKERTRAVWRSCAPNGTKWRVATLRLHTLRVLGRGETFAPPCLVRDETSSDPQLIERSLRGDDDAFRALVERYERKAFAVAVSIVRDHDEASNICQEAFLRVYRRLDSFDGQSQFFTWLYRIIHNLSIDHLRRARPTVSLEESLYHRAALAHVDTDPVWRLESNRLGERIRDALDRLSPAHREVVTLREINGLSYKQIADVMDCAIGTVMSRLFHARKVLQRELLDEAEAFGFTTVRRAA